VGTTPSREEEPINPTASWGRRAWSSAPIAAPAQKNRMRRVIPLACCRIRLRVEFISFFSRLLFDFHKLVYGVIRRASRVLAEKLKANAGQYRRTATCEIIGPFAEGFAPCQIKTGQPRASMRWSPQPSTGRDGKDDGCKTVGETGSRANRTSHRLGA